MIDLSKYEKVFEWDQVYGFTMSRRPIFSTVVYKESSQKTPKSSA